MIGTEKRKTYILIFLLFSCLFFGFMMVASGDRDTEIFMTRVKAYLGDGQAQFVLGNMYLSGTDAEQDTKKGLYWYNKSAENKYALAYVRLAAIYTQGYKVTINHQEAFKWLMLAAQSNPGIVIADVQNSIGYSYHRGLGTDKNPKEAIRWYLLAHGNRSPHAAANLYTIYSDGIEIPKNPTEAFKWAKVIADRNIAVGQVIVGIAYASGDGVDKDLVEAMKWYSKAAEQGEPSAYYNLGLGYAMGVYGRPDLDEAKKWARKAAVAKIAYAKNLQDFIETVSIFEKIAEIKKVCFSYDTTFRK